MGKLTIVYPGTCSYRQTHPCPTHKPKSSGTRHHLPSPYRSRSKHHTGWERVYHPTRTPMTGLDCAEQQCT